jgi:ribosomal protein S18 acetylase RimI-like enzyme
MSESLLTIAPARLEQLPEVARLAGEIWRAHYPGIITHEQIDYMLAKGYAPDVLAGFLDRPDRGLELALVDGETTGFAAWYLTGQPGEAKLDKLYVLQRRQRMGIGARLMAHVESLARVAGASTLILNVNKQNVKAIAAYERNGFATREAVAVPIGGGFVMDDFIMAKRLAGPG